MSYTIDICRGQLKPLNNWADYLFYLSFFPQLSPARSSGPKTSFPRSDKTRCESRAKCSAWAYS